MSTVTIVVLILAILVVLIALAVWLFLRWLRRHGSTARHRSGPRTVAELVELRGTEGKDVPAEVTPAEASAAPVADAAGTPVQEPDPESPADTPADITPAAAAEESADDDAAEAPRPSSSSAKGADTPWARGARMTGDAPEGAAWADIDRPAAPAAGAPSRSWVPGVTAGAAGLAAVIALRPATDNPEDIASDTPAAEAEEPVEAATDDAVTDVDVATAAQDDVQAADAEPAVDEEDGSTAEPTSSAAPWAGSDESSDDSRADVGWPDDDADDSAVVAADHGADGTQDVVDGFGAGAEAPAAVEDRAGAPGWLTGAAAGAVGVAGLAALGARGGAQEESQVQEAETPPAAVEELETDTPADADGAVEPTVASIEDSDGGAGDDVPVPGSDDDADPADAGAPTEQTTADVTAADVTADDSGSAEAQDADTDIAVDAVPTEPAAAGLVAGDGTGGPSLEGAGADPVAQDAADAESVTPVEDGDVADGVPGLAEGADAVDGEAVAPVQDEQAVVADDGAEPTAAAAPIEPVTDGATDHDGSIDGAGVPLAAGDVDGAAADGSGGAAVAAGAAALGGLVVAGIARDDDAPESESVTSVADEQAAPAADDAVVAAPPEPVVDGVPAAADGAEVGESVDPPVGESTDGVAEGTDAATEDAVTAPDGESGGGAGVAAAGVALVGGPAAAGLTGRGAVESEGAVAVDEAAEAAAPGVAEEHVDDMVVEEDPERADSGAEAVDPAEDDPSVAGAEWSADTTDDDDGLTDEEREEQRDADASGPTGADIAAVHAATATQESTEERRPRRTQAEMAAEHAAVDVALLRTFGVADAGDRPGSAPIVSLSAAGTQVGPRAADGPSVPVTVRVLGRDDEPVAGASAALVDDRGTQVATATTGAAGSVELSAPARATYMVVASAEQHQPGAVAVAVGDGPAEATVPLVRSSSVAGSVWGADEAIAGAEVALLQDGEIVEEATSGGDGGFRIPDLTGGRYVLSVTAPEYEKRVELIEVPLATDVRHDVDLEPSALVATSPQAPPAH